MYENYGADTFRLYEMSMGPLDESRPWNTRNVVGGMRFYSTPFHIICFYNQDTTDFLFLQN